MRYLARSTLVVLFALLAACAGKPPAPPIAEAPSTPHAMPGIAEDVLFSALGLVGTPYRWGGNTPDSGFDCSGLISYVYRDMLDLRLPRSSSELARLQGPKINQDRLAPGDLVFFGSGGNVSHVGIYVGEGRFVHAPSSGGSVRLDHLDGSYWRDHYTGARRVVN
jgi:cell wall-associated NlpC family hydrolase